MSKKSLAIIISSCVLLIGLTTVFLLIFYGVILLNNPNKADYPVCGVDVSSYQGEIDWQVLSEQEGMVFAFIKATEGSSFVDPKFEYNYSNAKKTHLRIGAYHFFSFDSSGETQAENFISTVEKTGNMLPPVIDLEFYGDKAKNPPSRADVHKELDNMLLALEQHYGVKPIIYVTKESYSLYVEGFYTDYDIWYRNVYTKSGLPDGRQWTFWQYTNRKRLDGYKGEEEYIDMNVFYGDESRFAKYAK